MTCRLVSHFEAITRPLKKPGDPSASRVMQQVGAIERVIVECSGPACVPGQHENSESAIIGSERVCRRVNNEARDAIELRMRRLGEEPSLPLRALCIAAFLPKELEPDWVQRMVRRYNRARRVFARLKAASKAIYEEGADAVRFSPRFMSGAAERNALAL